MSTAPNLVVLSAGAAKGVVEALAPAFRAETGAVVDATFGAVGTIREQFLASDRCDVLILTAAMLDALAREGRVDGGTVAPLGEVATGVAVRAGDPHPPIGDRAALRDCFARAEALLCPDTERATAGIHFVRVLRELGLWPAVESRIRAYPSGAVAMRALADAGDPGLVGCTQVTEILYTRGVELVGTLPREFALATTYSVAVAARAPRAALARRFAAVLAGPATRALREGGGFFGATAC
ncbi:MAG: substrate-binding domain-containing protein [Burkholderiales bacterium]